MLNSVIASPMNLSTFMICIGSALALGILTSLLFTRRGHHTGSLTLSLALLPAIVSLVIMMVNGNIGAGLAVAGTFALVRFRSVPGTAKEITALFFDVALGLACGMGYVVIAGIFFVVVGAMLLLLEQLHFGSGGAHRQLKITIPEDMDYEDLFDDLLEKYTQSYELVRVRTTNMGTLYELTYDIALRDIKISKEFMDEIRCRNGNLNIICGRESDKEMM